MDDQPEFELAPLFQDVGAVLRDNRQALNRADTNNGNHGDHMVEIFEIATHAADETRSQGLAESMEYAALLLEEQEHNGSAQVYALGLMELSRQFSQYGVTVDDLVLYVQGVLAEKDAAEEKGSATERAGAGDILKALLAGLSAWGKAGEENDQSDRSLNMGVLFDLGVAYMQAKQRGSSRIEVLADAAATVSPLHLVPHRYQSGKLAIQALLQAMKMY